LIRNQLQTTIVTTAFFFRAGWTEVNLLDNYYHISDRIDDFWSHSENRKSNTWTDHLDINAVMLACSLIAKEENHLQLSK